MQTAGYWIGRAQSPDEIILTPQEINDMNARAIALGRFRLVSLYTEFTPSTPVREVITIMYNFVNSQTLYHTNGAPFTDEEMQTINENLNLDAMNVTELRHVSFGIIAERADLRALPSSQVLVRRGDTGGYFDRLQMNTFEIGMPVAVLWRTFDRQWLFVDNGVTKGWITADRVALCNVDTLRKWESPDNFAVVTVRGASIYANAELTQYLFRATMGNRFPIATKAPKKQGTTTIYYPTINELGQLVTAIAYIDNSEISVGYVPYTSRNLLNIAFNMLHTPYGWGGMFGEQDCSGFILNMFRVFGIMLPRNSAEQAAMGDNIWNNTMVQALSPRQASIFFGIPGATVVQFPGHIMLYVGHVNGEAYAIHSKWSYREFHSSAKDTYTLKMPARVLLSRINFEDDEMRSPTYSGHVANISVIRPKTIPNIPEVEDY
jgi:hypothetical protein